MRDLPGGKLYDFDSPELKGLCGVYALVNMNDRTKYYIGYSTNIYIRIRCHASELKSHRPNHTSIFYNDFNIENFKTLILELCDKSTVIEKEYEWLHQLKPYYNKQIQKSTSVRLSFRQQKWFWDRIKIGDLDECWEWQHKKPQNKYGSLVIDGKHYHSNRIAYYLAYGDYHPAWKVLHSCNNKYCCNPNHLRLGTDQDNSIDYRKSQGTYCNYKKHYTKIGRAHLRGIKVPRKPKIYKYDGWIQEIDRVETDPRTGCITTYYRLVPPKPIGLTPL